MAQALELTHGTLTSQAAAIGLGSGRADGLQHQAVKDGGADVLPSGR
jgi:hypothetical protein